MRAPLQAHTRRDAVTKRGAGRAVDATLQARGVESFEQLLAGH